MHEFSGHSFQHKFWKVKFVNTLKQQPSIRSNIICFYPFLRKSIAYLMDGAVIRLIKTSLEITREWVVGILNIAFRKNVLSSIISQNITNKEIAKNLIYVKDESIHCNFVNLAGVNWRTARLNLCVTEGISLK